MRRPTLYLFLLLLIILTGCRQAGSSPPTSTPVEQSVEVVETPDPQPTSAATAQPSDPEATPYPAPPTYIAATPRTYPAPEGVTIIPPTPFTVPTPGSDTGVVTGILTDAETGEPLGFQTVYLGFKIYLTPGPGYTYGLQEMSSPHTLTTLEGEFAIGDVPPGEYIIMIFTPFGTSVVMQPNTDRELEIVVEAGELVDIGTMEVVKPELR